MLTDVTNVLRPQHLSMTSLLGRVTYEGDGGCAVASGDHHHLFKKLPFSQLYLIELLGLFNRSGATQAVALDISKAFDRVWHAGLLHKLKSCGISGQIFGLISSSQ